MDFETKLQLKLSQLLSTNLEQIPAILEEIKKNGVESDTAIIHAAISGTLTITSNLICWYHKELIEMINENNKKWNDKQENY